MANKGIKYVDVADGTYTYKVDFDNKTYKLVIDDGEYLESVPANAPGLITEAYNIETFLEVEGLKGFKNLTPKDQDPFYDNDDRLDYDDGQPDEQKEWEDFEGEDLPAEE